MTECVNWLGLIILTTYVLFVWTCLGYFTLVVVSQMKKHFLDFKLSPCFICKAFSFGCLPGVQVLKADVSELSVGSIFIGRSIKCDRDWSVRDIYTGPGSGKPEQSQYEVSNRLGVGGTTTCCGGEWYIRRDR
jgi:hypothetical protein